MCATLYFYFWIHNSMLSTKNLLSIHHYIETEQDPMGPSQNRPNPAPIPTMSSACLLLVKKTLAKK